MSEGETLKVIMPAISAFDSILERLMFHSVMWGINYRTLRKPGHPIGCPAVLICGSPGSVLSHMGAVSGTGLAQLCHIIIAMLVRNDKVMATNLI